MIIIRQHAIRAFSIRPLRVEKFFGGYDRDVNVQPNDILVPEIKRLLELRLNCQTA